MVLFPGWRPKFKRVVACTMIISALASAGSEIQELKYRSYQQVKAAHSEMENHSSAQAKAAYFEILGLEQVWQKTEKDVIQVREMLLEAVSIKSYAEKLAKEGKTEKSKEVYRELLKKYEQIIEILTMPDKQGNHIALAKNDISRIKNKLKGNKFFDQNRADIIKLEEKIYIAWVEVDKLTKDVSADVQEVERILGIID